MKTLRSFVALLFAAGAIVLVPSAGLAQDEKQAELERNFYNECYTKKDKNTCLPLAIELAEKYPASQYSKFAQQQIKGDLSDKFQGALAAFYNGPDAPKLDQLISAAEAYLARESGQTVNTYVTARVALATTYGVMGGIFKDVSKAKTYAERGLQVMSEAKAPEGWDQKEYDPLRETVLAQLNQFLGYDLLQQTDGDAARAVEYLNKAIAIKQKDGLGWKDPNNYWLRSNATFKEYQKLNAEYKALSDEQKTGDAGKALLGRINPTIDRMLSDYARVLATATTPPTQPLRDAAKEQFDQYWKYRTGTADGADEFVKKLEADPTIADPPVPAKAESSEPSADAPPVGAAGAPKLTTAVSAATGAATTETKTTKPATKAAPAAKGKGKAPARRKR